MMRLVLVLMDLFVRFGGFSELDHEVFCVFLLGGTWRLVCCEGWKRFLLGVGNSQMLKCPSP
jgi:hypothetical protein